MCHSFSQVETLFSNPSWGAVITSQTRIYNFSGEIKSSPKIRKSLKPQTVSSFFLLTEELGTNRVKWDIFLNVFKSAANETRHGVKDKQQLDKVFYRLIIKTRRKKWRKKNVFAIFFVRGEVLTKWCPQENVFFFKPGRRSTRCFTPGRVNSAFILMCRKFGFPKTKNPAYEIFHA